jgi:heme oxygenase
MGSVEKPFCCIQCSYFCNWKSNLTKHHATKRHVDKIQNTDVIGEGGFKCKNCVKSYKSYQGLWAHNKKCKPIAVASAVPANPDTDLHAEIVCLKGMIMEMAKNQQPTTINNNINNNNNYINIFLNDKCHNAYDIRKFIAGIDFSKENFEKLIQDYVGGNADIITKNYKSLLEYERTVYVFNGEDEHQKVAHIQYDNKWDVERELG